MKSLVLKIGGSLLFNEKKEINFEKISEFCEIIKSKTEFNKVIIICGGGLIAREYINIARRFKANEAVCDLFGIDLSRINSKLLISGLGDIAYPIPPESIEELSTALLFNKTIIMGGLQPGQSTTTVAMEVAEFINADQMIILTDVDGIYNKDPNKHKDAKLLQKITSNQLEEIIMNNTDSNKAVAGEYRIFDMISLQILKRSKIKVIVASGHDLSSFNKFWIGQNELKGTTISD